MHIVRDILLEEEDRDVLREVPTSAGADST